MESIDAFSSLISFATDVSQYLTFTFGQEEYGLEIGKVQEVRGFAPFTPIPNAPDYVKGVMNLRGTIIPVVDLRRKLGMAPVDYQPSNVIIVVTVGARVMGLVVDTVSDVVSIPKGDIQAPPEFAGQGGSRFLHGLAKMGEKVVLLLDIDKILSGEEQPVV